MLTAAVDALPRRVSERHTSGAFASSSAALDGLPVLCGARTTVSQTSQLRSHTAQHAADIHCAPHGKLLRCHSLCNWHTLLHQRC